MSRVPKQSLIVEAGCTGGTLAHRSYYREQKRLDAMLSEAKHLAVFASGFLAALGMTTFNVFCSEWYAGSTP
jgi:hypothetical protein